jgi:signal peptidase I
MDGTDVDEGFSAPVGADGPSGEPPRRRSFLLEMPVLILIALVIALLVKAFLVQAFVIPSISMVPTLEVGDRVLVSRIASGPPERGDILVFRNPRYSEGNRGALARLWSSLTEGIGFGQPKDEFLVKRVVGLPGETVQVSADGVSIDGQPLDEPYLLAGVVPGPRGSWEVPEGKLFMMGDNRDNSEDSRFFGPIPIDSVVGPVLVRVWPPARWGGV